MVARLTLAREKWSEGHSAAESVISFSEPGVEFALILAENDAQAFDDVMRAYRLPKGDDSEISVRKAAIRNATLGAAAVPEETASAAVKFLESIIDLAMFGNTNAMTDLAASAELANTATNIAAMNVKINLDSLEGEEAEEMAVRIDGLLVTSNDFVESIRSIVSERLGW
jgi:formiminotetrahydrofolate cyclodeaminase